MINQKRPPNSYLQNVRAYTTAKIFNNNETSKPLQEKILYTSTNPVNNFAEKGQHNRHEKQAAKEILGYAIRIIIID